MITRLARGGMAEIFLAVRRGLVDPKLVVLKRLREDAVDASSDDYGELLLVEARLAARLRHPNIVQTFRGDSDAGVPFLAMEFLDGQSLDRVLQAVWSTAFGSQAFATELALLVVCDVLSALEYAHELRDVDGSPLGIVHRDVSPHNIFVTYRGEVKLVDFGVAKHAWSSGDTELGAVRGKLTYMAPEQAERKDVDGRADVFAVGVVMWECLASQRLFAAESPAATLHKLLHEPLPPLAAIRPDLAPALIAICTRAVERDPKHRYPNAAAMRVELQSFLPDPDAARSALARIVEELFASERAARSALIQRALVGDANLFRSHHELAPAQHLASFAPDAETRLTAIPPETVTAARELPVASRAWRRAAIGLSAALLFALLALIAQRLAAPFLPLLAATMLPLSPAVGTGLTRSPEIVLRLCGSNTIGAELAPALIEAFLEHKGASAVSHRPGPDSEATTLVAAIGDQRVSVEISARGSATGFAGLAAGVCDVGMASRAIREDEAELLGWHNDGELRSRGTEHVIALDGIAVIVHPNNPLRVLDRAKLHDIFTGKITRWAELGGADEPITVLARDDSSGTFDTFSAVVLGRDALVASARRFAQSDALADAVASDPSAIGFVSLHYVRVAKALALSESGSTPMFPTQFTVATEGYLLSRRLYLYTLPRPRTPWITEFVSFALSRRAQEVTAKTQFIDLGLFTHASECAAQCPPRYAALVANAQRISVDFRFRFGSDELDGRAERDLDRVVDFLSDHRDAKLLLLGFADAIGSPAANLKLSSERASAIEHELAVRGVHATIVTGFGSAMPLASNKSENGRERNRRVEVWIYP